MTEPPKIGDVHQAAAWYHDLLAKDAARGLVRWAFRKSADQHGWWHDLCPPPMSGENGANLR